MFRKTVLLLVLLLGNLFCYGQYSIPQEMIDKSVLITSQISREEVGYGSGFFYDMNNSLFLITAGHVLFKSEKDTSGRVRISLVSDSSYLSYYSDNPFRDPKTIIKIETKKLLNEHKIIYLPVIDLAIVKLATKINDSIYNQLNFSYIYNHGSIYEFAASGATSINNISVGDDVFIFGFPKSLALADVKLFDSDRPLIRKGAIGGIDANNIRIIIDCPSYPGNSGGPVCVAHGKQISLIGFVDSFIPLVERSEDLLYKTVNTQVFNSGYTVVIPMDFANAAINRYFPNIAGNTN